MDKTLFLFLLIGSALSAGRAQQFYYATAKDVRFVADTTTDEAVNSALPLRVQQRMRRDPCQETANYIPDTTLLDAMPERKVRINFHFVNSEDSTHNYYGEEALKFVRSILITANGVLKKNYRSWLPYNDPPPRLPTRYQLALTPDPWQPGDDGIYFHFDDEVCFYIHKGRNRNLMDRSVIDRYGVQLDSVLNVFIMPHHPDSVASPTYSSSGVGVALGNAIKMAGMYENPAPGWAYSGVLNHEVGHVLGLQHAWLADGCDDTPSGGRPCWNRTKEPPCDTAASNNVMDYNAMQHAFTPCQIGRVQQRMADPNHRVRALLERHWCRLREDREIHVTNSMVWNGSRDLDRHLRIEPGARLRINCRVSMPPGGRISVGKEAELIIGPNALLHNDCNQTWSGIVLEGRGKKRGKITILGEPVITNLEHPFN